MVTHGFTEPYSAEQVIVVILERHGHRFSDCLETCKMDGAAYIMLFKDVIERCSVADVLLIECNFSAANLLYAFNSLCTGVYEVVYYHHVIASVQKLHACMCADISGTACD